MVSLDHVTASANRALGIGSGGAARAGTLTVTDSAFDGNEGGALRAVDATVTRSSLTGNAATGAGGGALVADTATVTDSELRGNHAMLRTSGQRPYPFDDLGGGAIRVTGALALTGSTLVGNDGAALVTDGWDQLPLEFHGGAVHAGSLEARNVSVTDNEATGVEGSSGGGLHVTGTATLRNVTLTENRIVASSVGTGTPTRPTRGAAVSASVLDLGFTTVTGNDGADSLAATDLTVRAAALGAPTGRSVCGPGTTATASAFTVATDGSCGLTDGTSTEDAAGLRLFPIASTGTAVEVAMPAAGSPVIDHVPTGACDEATDAVGTPRPQGAACDAGAAERPAALVDPADVPAGYHPVTPVRVLDTRDGTGGPATPIGTVARTVQLGGAHGIPVGATAVVLHLTATGSTAGSYLTAWPSGGPAPLAATSAFAVGETRNTTATVRLSPGGALDLRSSVGTTDVVADLVGWYDDGTMDGDRFTPTEPTRIVDTRDGTGGHLGKVGTAGVDIPVAGVAGIPADATAVVVNLAATEGTANTYVTAWPAGAPPPATACINLGVGETTSNLAVIPVGPAARSRSAAGSGTSTSSPTSSAGSRRPRDPRRAGSCRSCRRASSTHETAPERAARWTPDAHRACRGRHRGDPRRRHGRGGQPDRHPGHRRHLPHRLGGRRRSAPGRQPEPGGRRHPEQLGGGARRSRWAHPPPDGRRAAPRGRRSRRLVRPPLTIPQFVGSPPVVGAGAGRPRRRRVSTIAAPATSSRGRNGTSTPTRASSHEPIVDATSVPRDSPSENVGGSAGGGTCFASAMAGVGVSPVRVSTDRRQVDAVGQRLLLATQALQVGLPPGHLTLEVGDVGEAGRLLQQRLRSDQAGLGGVDAGVEVHHLGGHVVGLDLLGLERPEAGEVVEQRPELHRGHLQGQHRGGPFGVGRLFPEQPTPGGLGERDRLGLGGGDVPRPHRHGRGGDERPTGLAGRRVEHVGGERRVLGPGGTRRALGCGCTPTGGDAVLPVGLGLDRRPGRGRAGRRSVTTPRRAPGHGQADGQHPDHHPSAGWACRSQPFVVAWFLPMFPEPPLVVTPPFRLDTPPVPTSVRSMTESSPAVTYTLEGDVAVIRVDDGKANALSHALIDDIRAGPTGHDRGQAVALIGRPGQLSPGSTSP